MPAVRPYWKGYIKLALVSCPIGLWTASSSGERVAFRQINKKTGNRLRQQLVDDETREPVEATDKGRGYEYAKGSYLMIEDHELDAIEIDAVFDRRGANETAAELRLVQFYAAAGVR